MRPPYLSSETVFAARIGAFYAALFVLSGIVLPFFPVWLKAKGVDALLIGITLAAPQILRVLAIPVVTRQADRRDALRGTLVMLCGLGLAGYCSVAMAALRLRSSTTELNLAPPLTKPDQSRAAL